MTDYIHPITECRRNIEQIPDYDPSQGVASIYLCECGRRWESVYTKAGGKYYILVAGDKTLSNADNVALLEMILLSVIRGGDI